MPTLRAVHRAAKNLAITLLLFSTILLSISANTIRPVQANQVAVSPGKYDLTLGNNTGLVTLSYPNSTILTDSVGDLLFAVRLEPNSSQFHCDIDTPTGPSPLQHGDCQFSLNIYIPPDFTGLSIGNTWTSFTNNYNPNTIRLSRQSSADEIGPNWWEVSIQKLNVTCAPSLADPSKGVFLAYPNCPDPLTPPTFLATYQTKPQYIRLFQVTSPITAGRYFFKAFINGQSIGADNFPTLVVKASRDPATISGTLRDLGDRNPARAGRPIFLAPGTGAQIIATGYDPSGRGVSAQTFINSTSNGNYTLYGVSPGTYNLTVHAAGYIPITITQFPYPYPFTPWVSKPTPISVAAAQSLEGVDIYLTESPNVTGTVLSQTASGRPVPWGTVCSVSFRGPFAPTCSTPRAITVELLNLDGTTVEATNQQPYTLSTISCQSGNPGVNCATTPAATDYHFIIQYELSSWSGEIPQNDANFTSGLPTGEDYFVRAYVTSYIQLAEIRAHVGNFTVETEVPVPLIRTGCFTITVHLHDFNFPSSDLVDDPIKVNGTLTVSAYDMEGILRAQNSTSVFDGNSTGFVEACGFSSASQRGIFSQFSQNYGILPGTYYIQARLTAAPVVIGNAATTTNAPLPGALVVGDLYYQTANYLATIGLGDGDTQISLHMYRAAGIQLHIYSVDTEDPHLYRYWAFPGSPVFLTFIPTSEISVYQTNATQPVDNYTIPPPFPVDFPGNTAGPGLNIAGLPVIPGQSGSYECFVYTIGYTQDTPCHFTVQLGTNADASIWMVKNPFISLTVAFRHEGLLTGINSTEPYAQPINNLPATPTRLEAFDDQGNFVAANATYIPNVSKSGAPTQVANFTLAGMTNYYGDPRYVWSGFYDTTDQASQQSGGLLLYPWELSQPYHEFTIRIWVDGYYQLYPVRVSVPTTGNVSLTIVLDRASRISGTIAGPDFFDQARPQSWAAVDLEPNNYTLSGIIDVEPGNYTTTSLDGFFQVWVPQGTYGMGVLLAGYNSYQAELAVSAGSDISLWIWLENYQISTQPASGVIGTAIAPAIKQFSTYDEL
jgi:hypothetical protein